MTFRLEFKKSAAREFAALPKGVQQRIEELLTLLAVSPFSSALDIKKLKGVEDLYRARVVTLAFSMRFINLYCVWW